MIALKPANCICTRKRPPLLFISPFRGIRKSRAGRLFSNLITGKLSSSLNISSITIRKQ